MAPYEEKLSPLATIASPLEKEPGDVMARLEEVWGLRVAVAHWLAEEPRDPQSQDHPVPARDAGGPADASGLSPRRRRPARQAMPRV